MPSFEPTQLAALSALRSFVDSGKSGLRYEQQRNTDTGNNTDGVSRLSPYIRHRMLLETEVLKATLARETPTAAEKFIQEVCWRTYWKGWLEHRPQMWQRYVIERDDAGLTNSRLSKAINQAMRGATGIECFDAWVDQLTTTGYLHNHTRMWFASIWIFTLNLPWARGADFFMQHLCDADAASNTLSWRWVAGLHTPGKHYLARADNIARYTNGRFNPRGLLNETAQAKTESNLAPPMPKTQSVQSQFTSASAIRQNGVGNQSWLLVHDEDLSPEHWLTQNTIGGMIVVNSTQTRSALPIGQAPSEFSQGALEDATSRLQRHFGLEDRQIIRCASPVHLSKQLEGNQAFGRAPIVHAWIPVGPTQDALSVPFAQLRSQGVAIQAVKSDWDALAWPHATKGFFQFRTRIPELLSEVGGAASRLV
jgi:deoxyribodipyrimidine photo-lyase